jgi:hypothetical protein
MLRHEVRFVLRFGVMDEFRQLLDTLASRERAHGWVEQRCWRATGGRMNELVIAHEYADRPRYDAQRDAYHDTSDADFAEALASLAQLMVPATAAETLLEEV